MRSPSPTRLLNSTCSIYYATNPIDAFGGRKLSWSLKSSNNPCRSRHLSAEEMNSSGAERSQCTHMIYTLVSCDVTTTDLLVTNDGHAFDVTHSDDVNSQGVYREITGRDVTESNELGLESSSSSESSESTQSSKSSSSNSSLSSLTT